MKTRYRVQCMNEAGDYETVKEFRHLGHAINFAQRQKQAGKKTRYVIVDVGRNMVAIRI